MRGSVRGDMTLEPVDAEEGQAKKKKRRRKCDATKPTDHSLSVYDLGYSAMRRLRCRFDTEV